MASQPQVDWPVSYATPCPELEGEANAEQRALMEALAVEYLYNWTAGRYGLTEQVVRPCMVGCSGSTFWGSAVYTACGSCNRSSNCSCSVLESVALPGPVDSIVEVWLDGEVLPPSSYVVYDHRFLVRTDGGEWPRCQEYGLDASEHGTWEVRYLRGTEVPTGGQVAAGVLACEFAKAAANVASCRLPQRLQSITRQGVTVTVLDSFEGLEQGHTGIWIIDSWVSSVMRAPRGGSVRSVDIPVSPRRRTWSSGA